MTDFLPLIETHCRSDISKAELAAGIINLVDGRESYRALWDALDEPTREELLTWFCEWDGGERWNPRPKRSKR